MGTNRLSWGRSLALLLLVLLAPMLSASAWSQTVLRTVPSSDLKILDPIWNSAYITRNHGYMIYDTLFAMDEKGAIKPQMVDKYSASADNKVWTFTLRPGLKFHDGASVTSQDVIASLARWSQRDILGKLMYESLESIAPQGADGFRMSFRQPFGAVLDALGKPSSMVPFIMPRRVAETPADRQIDELVGSGPFTLTKPDFRPGDRVIYRKNAAYVPRKEPASGLAGGKVVNVDQVEWVLLRDPQTQANALLKGEVDMLEVIPPSAYTELRTAPGVELVDVTPTGVFAMSFNHKAPPFDNPKAVRAAMLAVNQEAMLRAQVTFREFYKPCASVYPCGSIYASDKTGFYTGKPQFEEARRLLKESGYDGTPVVIPVPGDVPTMSKLPAVYAQLLKQVGFNVDLRSADWAMILTRLNQKQTPADGGWSVFITFWGGVDAGSPLTYRALSGKSAEGYYSSTVDDAEIERLKLHFIQTTDAVQRKAIATLIAQRALDNGVVIPLGEAGAPAAVRRNVVSGLLRAPAQVYWNVRKN